MAKGKSIRIICETACVFCDKAGNCLFDDLPCDKLECEWIIDVS